VEQLTAIIHKMMDKSPRGRYQSLYGAVRDLESVAAMRSGGRPLAPFPVATHDQQDEFHLPDAKLYGRDPETQRIVQFVETFGTARETGVVLVGGPSGVGKSSLVRHVFRTLYQQFQPPVLPGAAPLLLSGKHDRIKHTPYSAVLEAYQGIARRILMTQGAELQMWKDELDAALSPNGKVLVDVIPEMETVLGPQPSVPVLPPVENRIRFQRVLAAFMQVFLAKFPVILFLDGT
jgi:predicted ATPase